MTAAFNDIAEFGAPCADGTRRLHLMRSRPSIPDHPRPVLLLHGSSLPASIAYTMGLGGNHWLGDLASRGHDAWALDFRGYGKSWKPADDGVRPSAPVANTAQAVEDLSQAIAFIIAETGADAVDVVGWSWGAAVAASYAAQGNPIGRLVLHAPQWLRDTTSPMVTPQSMTEPYRTVDAAAFVDRWLGRMDPAVVADLGPWEEELERVLEAHAPIQVPNGSARDIAGHWMAGRPSYDPADIDVPTLVIVGAGDTDTPPAMARHIFDHLGTRAKRYAEVPGGTHFAILEPARAELFRITSAFLAAPEIEEQEFTR